LTLCHVQWFYQPRDLCFPHVVTDKNHQNTQTDIENTPPIANNQACARDHIKMLSLWYMWYKHTIIYFHAAIYHLSSATFHSYKIMYNDTDCRYDFLQQVISE